MAALLAVVLVVGFWALLWAGAVWAGPDTRDGRDWRSGRSITSRPRRHLD